MPEEAFGIYLHWPFCISKCPYCDFNSHVAERIDQTAWRRALLAELDHFAGLAPGRRVSSIFFGGGTPSLMDPATTAALLERIGAHWALADDVEITLEANPGTIDAARFQAFRAAGINRLSMGLQALDDASLAFLGRRHSAAEAERAVLLARGIFPRISFDLIYARPGQGLADWQAELTRAIGMAADHLSLYQLTIEPGTAFHPRAARGDFILPDDGLAADLYDLTQEITAAHGLPAYEVSNHAAPGAKCRHNLLYWQGGDYLGIGPGAHGRLTGEDGLCRAFAQARAPATWLDKVARDGHGTAETLPLSLEERAEELLMMGLRLDRGLSEADFARRIGRPLDTMLDTAGLARMLEAGLVLRQDGYLRTSRAGRLLLNSVLAALLAG